MISSLARNDAEIGARMGICFTFTGTHLTPFLMLAVLLRLWNDIQGWAVLLVCKFSALREVTTIAHHNDLPC